MNNLMLHCGGYGVDREAVDAVHTPPATKSFCPIAHGQAINLVTASLEDLGYTIKNSAHALANNGQRYFGLMELAGDDGAALSDYSLIAGIRNSHDHSFCFGVSMGSRVFVCDNLSFSGEVRVARKHTALIQRDLPRLVNGAVGLLGGLRRTQDERFAKYKEVEIANAVANDLLVRTIEAGVLPVTKLKLAIEEWKTPRHDEFVAAGPTLWRLYNAITEAIKGRVEPIRLATPAILGIFVQAAGLDGRDAKLAAVLACTEDAEVVAA